MLFSYIQASAKNFFDNIIEDEIEDFDGDCAKSKYYISSIDFMVDDISETYDLYFQKETLENVAHVLLGDKHQSTKSIIDLSNEVANLLIGSAKVLIEESNVNIDYKISTPSFIGEDMEFDESKYEEKYIFGLSQRCAIIAKKRM